MEKDIKTISEITSDSILIGEWIFFPALFKLVRGEDRFYWIAWMN
jgi:hypothetical protein